MSKKASHHKRRPDRPANYVAPPRHRSSVQAPPPAVDTRALARVFRDTNMHRFLAATSPAFVVPLPHRMVIAASAAPTNALAPPAPRASPIVMCRWYAIPKYIALHRHPENVCASLHFSSSSLVGVWNVLCFAVPFVTLCLYSHITCWPSCGRTLVIRMVTRPCLC
jgi:hypothetical protein